MATGLATRCSACATVFRVVPDQLRVSEGWVRCGRCAQVFNALEALVDLETGLPERAAGAAAAMADGADEAIEANFDIAQPAAKPGRPELPPQPPSHLASSAASTAPSATRQQELQRSAADDVGPWPPSASVQTPSFVQTADRAARWRRPRVRAALLLVVALSLLGLAAQTGIEYRDLLAAHVPQTRPWLEQACLPLGCSVQAARAIESLAVESSGLVRVEKSNLYKLQVSLRNHAAIDLAVPALDVTLTDTQGQLIARKVLRLTELGAPQATIAAGRELGVQATLQAAAGAGAGGEAAVPLIAGYTIELFYP